MMISENDLRRYNKEELLVLVQRLQQDKLHVLHEHGTKMKDVNQRLQTHLLEIRNLKEINRKLQDDNQELRDLCCFLDDDRQKCRKLSKEWQRFGRYTSSVIKTEVGASQSKLTELSNQLEAMVKDNDELKELVLYLDDDRSSAHRDRGDGSSNSTTEESSAREITHKFKDGEAMKYIQHLEDRIKLLEEQLSIQLQQNTKANSQTISQAMKVLNIHNQLDKQPREPQEDLGSGEKAILRELCNVAWKALEDVPDKDHRPLLPQDSRV